MNHKGIFNQYVSFEILKIIKLGHIIALYL